MEYPIFWSKLASLISSLWSPFYSSHYTAACPLDIHKRLLQEQSNQQRFHGFACIAPRVPYILECRSYLVYFRESKSLPLRSQWVLEILFNQKLNFLVLSRGVWHLLCVNILVRLRYIPRKILFQFLRKFCFIRFGSACLRPYISPLLNINFPDLGRHFAYLRWKDASTFGVKSAHSSLN